MAGVEMEEESSLLSMKGLKIWYEKNHPVVSDLDIRLSEHEVVGLIGLNGAGKTTLIKTLSGLLDTYQVETVLWKQRKISFRDRAWKLQRYTIFSEDHSFEYFTPIEYFSYVAASYGKKIEIKELAEGFHFEEFLQVPMKELSMGNRKKAYLIMAFALRLPFLLLDEPVNGLDFQSTEYLYHLITEYRQYGTILFSSHILESICLTSDRVLVLENGTITQSFCGNQIQADRIREVLTV